MIDWLVLVTLVLLLASSSSSSLHHRLVNAWYASSHIYYEGGIGRNIPWMLQREKAYAIITGAHRIQPRTRVSSSFTMHESGTTRLRSSSSSSSSSDIAFNLHGQQACFLPLQQLAMDYYAPRIIRIAGSYPGLNRQDYESVTSEPSSDPGQWNYDFPDANHGPQLGTVAIEGTFDVYSCQDPVVVIADHFSLGIELPKAIVDPVDVTVLVDRSQTSFIERKFMVIDPGSSSNNNLQITAFPTKRDMPSNCQILGHVILVQIPWLPSMAPTKSGFMEADEDF
jgi:hypothetical protein